MNIMKKTLPRMSIPLKLRMMLLLLYDTVIIQFSSLAAIWVRYEFTLSAIPEIYFKNIAVYAAVNTAFTLTLFFIYRLYRNIWAFAGFNEMVNISFACLASGAQVYLGMSLSGHAMPKSYYILYTGLLLAGISSVRLFYISLCRMRRKRNKNKPVEKIMMIGAGEAGNILLREITDGQYKKGEVVCLIDDDSRKKGCYVHGVKIFGNRELIPELAEKMAINKIIVAMPSVRGKEIKRILEICRDTNCDVRILPDNYRFLKDEVSVSKLRDIDTNDLLGRDPVEVNLNEITNYIKGKTVMVTGGGGSIGSELCLQAAKFHPAHLIILDIYENNVYELQQDISEAYPGLNLTVLIASVRDINRINQIFEKYKPDIIYHAAAHKHVPLMESNPNESIKNNVFGTYNTARAAGEYGAERFVLISTDKAVNPTNIMGASKRMCEMVIQVMNENYNTEFVAVRFGNVLGSNGSVIPLFKKQIARGGPVKVTHKEIIRFFMTIPEAVSLVLQAGAYARGGEIFVLDMGEPVKIDDLARNLIKMSGLIPDVDIKIQYTGLRPGEKLYEELLNEGEGLRETDNKLIFIGRQTPINTREFMCAIEELKKLTDGDGELLKLKVQEIVNTYTIENKIPEEEIHSRGIYERVGIAEKTIV